MNTHALKDRLKIIAKEKGVTFNEVWKQLLLERFLARLSVSEHQEKFIFKGGLLLAQYLVIGRETTDADFLVTKLKAEAPTIEATILEILASEVDDGFLFSWSDIEPLTQPHMNYPGFRVTLNAAFEKMKDNIQLDIGVGDLVKAVEENFEPLLYKGKPIFAGEISLYVYPVETIFTEKLETIVSKGAANSRMKDYHDVLLMIRERNLLDVKKLKAAMTTTFENRGTQYKIPIAFEAAGMATLQTLWVAHRGGLSTFKDKLPEQIATVLTELNTWLRSVK